MPKRIQRHRTKGWKMPPNTVYVGRPSRYGNSCKVGDWTIGKRGRQTAASAVEVFRLHATVLQNKELMEALRGKDLACWCPLDQPCHADVLLEIANG
jgi:Domain of unknown function (DUF4326)